MDCATQRQHSGLHPESLESESAGGSDILLSLSDIKSYLVHSSSRHSRLNSLDISEIIETYSSAIEYRYT